MYIICSTVLQDTTSCFSRVLFRVHRIPHTTTSSWYSALLHFPPPHIILRSLDVNTLLYFGGVESHVPRVSSVAGFHFDGCLADLVINDRIINLADPVRRYGTSEGCAPRDGKCRTGYCLHGECVSVWNGTVCHCEKFPECRQTSSPVSLSNGYIQLLPSEGTVTTVGHFTLAFRTRQTCATLIGFGDVASVQVKVHVHVYIVENTLGKVICYNGHTL